MFRINKFLFIASIVVWSYSAISAFHLRENDLLEEPLLLTPLIRANKLKEALLAATVKHEAFKNISSYSGYLTVNDHFNSNLFFWFFPSESNIKEDPVVLWLQGGPGSSSMIGLFAENGPFTFTKESKLALREYRWTRNHSVIYIDNPVGTGFSFTDENGFARNETIIGEQLFEALQQFFTLFSNLQHNPFFVTGESYAGKYVPAISYAILKKNPDAKIKINLKGLAIGNGLCDPVHQLKYANYLYELGLVDLNARELIADLEIKGARYAFEGDYRSAFGIFHKIIYENDEIDTVFRKETGFKNYYNYLHSESTTDIIVKNLKMFFRDQTVRNAIHVGNKPYDSTGVEKHMQLDVMKSVAHWIEELLANYRVLFYNGQLDVIIGYPGTLNFLQHLQFNGAHLYEKAERHKWFVGDELAGYVKKAANLTEVLVRNAGHMVPQDQPKWAYDLISKFINNKL